MAQQDKDTILEIISEADKAYRLGNPTMSDACYDELYNRYIATKSIIDLGIAKANKFIHKKPVLSLKKAYSDEALISFLSRSVGQSSFLLEPKIDGVSLVLHYREGKLSIALSRGNKVSGVDVTRVVKQMNCVPLSIDSDADLLVLRGELCMSKADFDHYNSRLMEKNKFSSARSLVAGSLMLKNLDLLEARKFSFIVFNLMNATDFDFKTDTEALLYLSRFGFDIIEFSEYKELDKLCRKLNFLWDARETFPFNMDGFVVKVNDLSVREKLSEGQKYPNWAIARKFRTVPVETTVKEIIWSVSEKAKRTPIAILDEVQIANLRVKRASLHSEKFMKAMNIRVGSRVKVICAGGVIPEIVDVID